MWYMLKPQFFGVRGRAANISAGVGGYTAEMFAADFPQFYTAAGCVLPATILDEFINQANMAITPDKWVDGWRFCAGLYVAHYATLYLRSYSPGVNSPAEAAASGDLVGVVSKAQLGDSSVEYDTGALTAATANWGDLNATSYGQMLATRARLVGMGGCYVI